jgi:hypothetical protein
MDIHEHDMRAVREGVLKGLRATTSQGHDLIPKAAELFGQV